MSKKTKATQPPANELQQKPAQEIVRLRRTAEYDTLNPEEQIRSFLNFVRLAKARYKENMRLVAEYQLQRQDLDHYAEMHEDLDRTGACRYYRKMREIGRKRRAAKNEAALLEPLITLIESNPDIVRKLEHAQGQIGAKKTHLDSLDYTAKTDVLNE